MLAWDLGLQIAVAAGVAVSAGFASTKLRRRPYDEKVDGHLYQDKDGIASEESQRAFSVKVQNVLGSLIVLLGFGIAVAGVLYETAVRRHFGGVEEWVRLGVWALLALQQLYVLRARDPLQRFDLALLGSVSYLLALGPYAISFYALLHHEHNLRFGAATSSLALCISGFLLSIAYPRKPIVYSGGRRVDGEMAASMLGRVTFAWPSYIIEACRGGKQFEYEDLPVLDHRVRARDLFDAYEATAGGRTALWRLLRHHAPQFGLQYFLTVVDAVLMIGPQIAMYNLLRILEARDAGGRVSTAGALVWVFALAVGIVVAGFVNNWFWWVGYGMLNIPLRVQLAALIFTKAMRRKDIKGVDPKKESTTVEPADLAEADGTEEAVPPVKGDDGGKKPEAKAEDDDANASMQKTRQGVINLIGVDAKRVGDAANLNSMLLGAACRLIMALTFAYKLLGLPSLAAGLSLQLIIIPLNIHFTRQYTTKQDEVMAARDRKLAVLNEALSGIRQIKFAALEDAWENRIMAVREKELKAVWGAMMADVCLMAVWIGGPVLLSAVTITTYTLLHGGLPPSVAFTSISLFSQIENVLAWIPEMTTNLMDAWVSFKRINTYLEGPERGDVTQNGETIEMVDASIAWPAGEPDPEAFTLRHVNLAFPPGELSVVSGRTGSGKSLLLAAILGEVEVLAGSIKVPRPLPEHERHDDKAHPGNWILESAIAYVGQQPWIENASFRANVTFGLPLDESRYRAVISACALDADLAILPDGDSTEIGASGINLSGGQRWRITLARALYSRAGILILDDIFSAVDAHVGKHIFEHALTGDICEGRTRVLVTHHVALCAPRTKYEVRLGNGTVEYAGYVQRTEDGEPQPVLTDDTEAEETIAERVALFHEAENGAPNDTANGTTNGTANGENGATKPPTADIIDGAPKAPRKFVEEETREEGWIRWHVYTRYLDACGGVPFWVVVIVIFSGYQSIVLARSWVLRLWTQQYKAESFSAAWAPTTSTFIISAPLRTTEFPASLKFYLSLYTGFASGMVLTGALRWLWIFSGSIKASRLLFRSMLHVVLRAPLRWLDTVPVGRVLNRFTADFNVTDMSVANSLAACVTYIMMVIGVFAAGIIVSPWMVLCAALLLLVCTHYSLYYLNAARQMKRLESTAKSPIFDFFSAALAGVTTIRAFDKTPTFTNAMFTRVDIHARALYYQWLLNRWLGSRFAVVGALFSFVVATLVVSLKGMDAALSGFALGFTLHYTEVVSALLRNFAQVELGMNAAERILEYTDLPTEPDAGADPPAAWPSGGEVHVRDLEVAYAPDLPPVLTGLTFKVGKGERVGVVGRTGAGKSSLTLALFRFLEARKGSIVIDGLDIASIRLGVLRSRLAIIPQDPVLFSGTVRSNLDPFERHGDEELREALVRVQLVGGEEGSGVATPVDGTQTPGNTNVFASLGSAISEGGQNLSQGQRQLLCLARAIVARPQLMVLDEATSAVDKVTDGLIQRSIREEFEGSTLLVIAHRLSTIVDFDRILVMSGGRAVEYDSPRVLLGIEGGVFRGMVESSGEGEVLREIIMRGRE
ncbi:P-loop containing nucleoside triphosphate hydrolase protein [Trichodelitschia bisporula]|uniref:P-loop containing nucleoside triphosphate hydrolase protein n=1 Tax=Trichodelitschia bisporula TaxID=703511 RepID=A0A6G1I3U2_9PEZI|nr:P-loop containing nucleoside triphosphate hydrolase protein [Trichodelitschia bisporula]